MPKTVLIVDEAEWTGGYAHMLEDKGHITVKVVDPTSSTGWKDLELNTRSPHWSLIVVNDALFLSENLPKVQEMLTRHNTPVMIWSVVAEASPLQACIRLTRPTPPGVWLQTITEYLFG